MIPNICVEDDKMTIITTDEVEMIGRVKVRLVLTFLYGDFCVREVYKHFYCEGCDKNWPSQKDHECLLLSEEEIFESGYDDVRTRINLEVLCQLCERFTKLAGIPMTTEWETFLTKLTKVSARTIFYFWEDMTHTNNPEEQIIVDFVHMTHIAIENEGEWDSDVYQTFVRFMKE